MDAESRFFVSKPLLWLHSFHVSGERNWTGWLFRFLLTLKFNELFFKILAERLSSLQLFFPSKLKCFSEVWSKKKLISQAWASQWLAQSSPGSFSQRRSLPFPTPWNILYSSKRPVLLFGWFSMLLLWPNKNKNKTNSLSTMLWREVIGKITINTSVPHNSSSVLQEQFVMVALCYHLRKSIPSTKLKK